MLTPNSEDIQNATNKWLEEKGLTYREAGKILGCSHGAIGNIANGTAKSIRPKLMIALEPRINKHRDPAILQEEMKRKTSSYDDDTASLCKFAVSIICNIQIYKEANGYSYDDLKNKFNVPVVKLAEWLEADYSGKDHFTVSAKDFPIFAAFVSQVLSEQA
jgi:transposase